MPSIADKTREILQSATLGQIPEDSEAIVSQIERLEAKVEWYDEQYLLNKARMYGASSEQTPAGQEAMLFDEAEAIADPTLLEPTVEVITYPRRKKETGKREAQLADLPVEEVPHRLPEAEQVCPQCSGALHEIGAEVRQEIKIIPGQFVLVKHKRYKYACRHCQQEETTTPIVTATMPIPAFPNGIASASAVAHFMSRKFVDSQPLYRQEQHLRREGIDLSRQTLANWILKGAQWLEIPYAHMKSNLLARAILHADETVLQVLKEPGRAAQTKSFLWQYCTGREGPPIVLFEYQTTRAAEHPKRFLEGFKGFLQADGYQAYHHVEGVTILGCWAHARRKFKDALTALSVATRKKPGTGTPAAQIGLDYCNKLFAIERDLSDATPQDRLIGRQERSKPVLDEFKVWLDGQVGKVLPKSALGEAVTYAQNQWAKLTVFLTDGRLELDNNRAERSIKPFVIGRKNWLFANTPGGARGSAVIYSIVETAKLNALRPEAYLTFLFEQLPNVDRADPQAIDALMPWAETVQQHFRTPPAKATR
jgi:transposase